MTTATSAPIDATVDRVVRELASKNDLLVPWGLSEDEPLISTDVEGLTSGVYTIREIVEAALRLRD